MKKGVYSIVFLSLLFFSVMYVACKDKEVKSKSISFAGSLPASGKVISEIPYTYKNGDTTITGKITVTQTESKSWPDKPTEPGPIDTVKPPPVVSGDIIFKGDWNKSAGGFQSSQFNSGMIVKDGTTYRGGLAAAKVSVNAQSKHSCESGGCQRSEVAEITPNGNDEIKTGLYFYSFSAKADNSVSGYAVLQLHGHDDLNTNPMFALAPSSNTWDVRLRYGAVSSMKNVVSIVTGNNSLVVGKWYEFMIAINFQTNNTGYVTVWVRTEGETAWKKMAEKTGIPTFIWNTSTPSIVKHYWKEGYYRPAKTGTDVVHVGPLIKGTTFLKVEQTTFGTLNGF